MFKTMPQPNLSPWFPSTIRPVHVGVYKIGLGEKVYYSRWENNKWYSCHPYWNDAALSTQGSNWIYVGSPTFSWCGLAHKPK